MVASSTFKQELLLREYGRNVQNIVSYILTIEDRTQRTRMAQLLVNLMSKLNPSVREVQDSQQKLWNHLYVMSDGKLEVDSPFPLSAMEYLNDKPQKVHYPVDLPTYKHYGRNVELLIERATQIEDQQERENAIISLGKLMKMLYRTYNKESITDEIILNNIRELSKGKLDMDLAYIEKHNLFETGNGRPAGSPAPASTNQPSSNKNKKGPDSGQKRKNKS
jgi:hypothetical protein